MRAIKVFIAVVSISICLQSCEKDEKIVTFSSEYLPLEIGNYWQLDYSEKKEVIGKTTVEGKEYYLLRYLNDTSYYRVENGRIYAIEYADNESLKFNLSARVNDTWKYHSQTVKLISKTDTIVINNKKIANCYHFSFDNPAWIDDEHSIWLAPGIGFIQEQCGECQHPFRKLDKAKISAVETDY